MNLTNHSAFVVLLSGVAFLLYGLSRSSEALQKLASNQIRRVLGRLSENGWASVLVGIGLTLLMQSSGAVTATLVNLGTARVLSLPQVMGVLIGTAIGAAITVQLLGLHVSAWGLPVFLFGFLFFFTAKRHLVRDTFEFVMSIGLLFFGLEVIGLGARELLSRDFIHAGITHLRDHAFLSILISAALTTVFHSSTATMGILIALAGSSILPVEDAVLWMYGANIGTSSTGLMVSVAGDYVGRRIAWANFLYRFASVVIFIPLSDFAIESIKLWFVTPASQIAFIYMFMNLFSALVFFPLRDLGVRLVEFMIVPDPQEREFTVRFLKRSNYESFSIALAHAKREVLEMGDIVFQMVEASLGLLRRQDFDLEDNIRRWDDKVDLLLKEIKLFLIRVSQMAPEGLNPLVIDLVSFGSDLEASADIIDHHIMGLARKKHKKRLEFHRQEWKDLEALHTNVVRAVSLALSCFQTEDPELANDFFEVRHQIREQENRFREAHISHLSHGSQPGIGTSAIYLECISTYLQLVEVIGKQPRRLRRQAEQQKIHSSRDEGKKAEGALNHSKTPSVISDSHEPNFDSNSGLKSDSSSNDK